MTDDRNEPRDIDRLISDFETLLRESSAKYDERALDTEMRESATESEDHVHYAGMSVPYQLLVCGKISAKEYAALNRREARPVCIDDSVTLAPPVPRSSDASNRLGRAQVIAHDLKAGRAVSERWLSSASVRRRMGLATVMGLSFRLIIVPLSVTCTAVVLGLMLLRLAGGQ